MKPTKKTKRTKGRVMYCDPYLLNAYTTRMAADRKGIVPSPDRSPVPVAVIPCATAKDAKAVVKMHDMTHSERFHAVQLAMLRPRHIRTLCILAALGLAEDPKSFT